MNSKFSPEQIGEGVMALAVTGGSPAKAKELLDFKVSEATLVKWRDETHAQQYFDACERAQRDVEAETIQNLRTLARRATEVEAELLERASGAWDKDVPSALRAVADVKAKSVDKLMAMTGRTPETAGGDGDLRGLLEGMAAKGLITLNVNLNVEKETQSG